MATQSDQQRRCQHQWSQEGEQLVRTPQLRSFPSGSEQARMSDRNRPVGQGANSGRLCSVSTNKNPGASLDRPRPAPSDRAARLTGRRLSRQWHLHSDPPSSARSPGGRVCCWLGALPLCSQVPPQPAPCNTRRTTLHGICELLEGKSHIRLLQLVKHLIGNSSSPQRE